MGPSAAPGGGAGERPVIVIFGAAVRADGSPSTALRRRTQAGFAFGRRHPGAVYVVTGAVGRFGPSEASVMARLLRQYGVPDRQIVLEETGTNTLSSVRAVAELLRRRGYRGRVFAASSRYHLPRCVLLMGLAGLDAWACPAPAGSMRVRFRLRWYRRVRELVAIPVDVAAMLWKFPAYRRRS